MIPLISFIIIALLFMSIFCGVFLAYHTCEELSIIGRYLEILQYALSISGFIIADYIFFGISFISAVIATIIIFGTFMMFGVRRYFSMTRSEFRKFQSITEMLAFAALLALFALKGRTLLASIVFLLGLVIGTVGTRRFLFSIYDQKKFTTLTIFTLKEKAGFYINALKEYHWVLYPAIISALMASAI